MDCDVGGGTCFMPNGNRCLHKNHLFYACGAFSSAAVRPQEEVAYRLDSSLPDSHLRSHPSSSSFSRTSELTPMDTSIFAVPPQQDPMGGHHPFSYVDPSFSETNIYVNTHVGKSSSPSQPSVQLQKEPGDEEASTETYPTPSSLVTH